MARIFARRTKYEVKFFGGEKDAVAWLKGK
jgi:hypothetical protein